MASNWRIGIDHPLSVDNGADSLPDQTALAGFEFFDAQYSGKNGAVDGTTSKPYANPPDSSAIAGTIFILSSDTFTPKSGAYLYRANCPKTTIIDISSAGDQLDLADGRNEGFILLGNGVSGALAAISSLSYTGSLAEFENTVFQGVCIDNILTGETITFNNCIILNPTELTTGSNTVNLIFNNCTFEDGTITTTGNVDLNNCVINATTFPNGIQDSINSNYFGVSQPTTSGTDTGNTTNDPQDQGDPNDLEFVIPPNSPLVGAAQNDNTQGAFKLGEIANETADIDYNIDTTGGVKSLDTGKEYGFLRNTMTAYSDQIRKSPTITLNGIFDQAANLPVRNMIPTIPVLDVKYRETVSGSDIDEKYVYGLPMYKDDTGRTTGQLGFNWGDIDDGITLSNLVDVAERQFDFELENKKLALPFNGTTESAESSGYTLNLGDATTADNDFINLVVFTKNQAGAGTDPISANNSLSIRLEHLETTTLIARSRFLVVRNGRVADAQISAAQMSETSILGTRSCWAANRVGNNATNWVLYQNEESANPGATGTNNLLNTDDLQLVDPYYGRSPATGYDELTLQSRLVLQPIMTSDQYLFLSRQEQGLTWDLLSSQKARDKGIGVSGTDTIGVSGITTLIEYFTESQDLHENASVYYFKERVTGTLAHAQLFNFSADPNTDLVDW